MKNIWANIAILIIINLIFIIIAAAIKDQFDSDWGFTCGWIASAIYYAIKYK
jgi:hypothetical protein